MLKIKNCLKFVNIFKINTTKRHSSKLNTEFLNKTFSIITDYLSNLKSGKINVINYLSPEELQKEIDLKLSDKDTSDEEILELTKKVLKYSAHSGHQHYCNSLFGGFSEYALAGDYISSSLNGIVTAYELAPVFSIMEKEVTRSYCDFLGWTHVDTMFAPGGSLANFYALLSARHFYFPHAKTDGILGFPRMKIFTSEVGHYSIEKGAIMMSIGSKNVVKVKADKYGRMIPEDLEQKIYQCKHNGEFPILVNVTLGTTVFGTFDPINEIADICQRNKIWLHADACFGGSMFFLEEFREKVKEGMSKADSLSWDPHKVLSVPMQCSLFVTRHKNILLDCNSLGADYLFMKDKVIYDAKIWDKGDQSIQCGRHIDVLKLWMYWKAYGSAGISVKLRNALDNARYLAALANKHHNFELIVEPDYVSVSFFYLPNRFLNRERDDKFWEELDHIAPKIKADMVKRGKLMVAYQRQSYNGQNLVNFFRPIVTLGKSKDDMEHIINEIHEIGKDL
jgi:glutamate/tyrosine decarboxylase-like PLP-dependent enzyme